MDESGDWHSGRSRNGVRCLFQRLQNIPQTFDRRRQNVEQSRSRQRWIKHTHHAVPMAGNWSNPRLSRNRLVRHFKRQSITTMRTGTFSTLRVSTPTKKFRHFVRSPQAITSFTQATFPPGERWEQRIATSSTIFKCLSIRLALRSSATPTITTTTTGHTYVTRQISGASINNEGATNVPAPVEGVSLPPRPVPAADAPQVTDFAQDVQVGLLAVLPLNDPLDIFQ